jgi:hypothetical protein
MQLWEDVRQEMCESWLRKEDDGGEVKHYSYRFAVINALRRLWYQSRPVSGQIRGKVSAVPYESMGDGYGSYEVNYDMLTFGKMLFRGYLDSMPESTQRRMADTFAAQPWDNRQNAYASDIFFKFRRQINS